MYFLSNPPAFIQKMYSHHSLANLKLKIPAEFVSYNNNLLRLHNTPGQLLQEVNLWIDLTGVYRRPHSFMEYYDENDPDLMIEPIDDAKHRKTWAICFEAYLRRQLLLLYTPPEFKNIQNIVYKNLTLPLPVVNVHSTNPDDIRMQRVKIKSFSLCERSNITYHIPPEYRHLTWYSKKNRGEELPKFRCRPALLNSMDCMQLLYNNMEFASEEIMIKTAYFLRPFRFFLPFTFMFDIFGGFRNSYFNRIPIEYNFPDHATVNRFPDSSVLIDKVERSFLDGFNIQKRRFSEDEVILPRRANAFLAGGSVSYMLGLTTQFNDLDIYIEYDPNVFAYLTLMSVIVTNNDGSRDRERIWVSQDEYYDESNDFNKSKIQTNKNSLFTLPDPKIIFQNRYPKMVEIHSVYKLNPNLAIVKHFQKKYEHLPQIIFIQSKLKLNEYNILKLITGFDLSICRNALAFMHAKAFHLRKPVLENLYGLKQINENSKVIKFVTDWQISEKIEFSRKLDKVAYFNKVIPNERKLEYDQKWLVLANDDKQKAWHIKQQRKMMLIKWPYDTNPLFGETTEKTKNRFEKYLKRLPQTIVDFENNVTLPMQVYPLKYLAYWELQKNANSINHNCLCNFNYRFEYFVENDDEKPSTSSKT